MSFRDRVARDNQVVFMDHDHFAEWHTWNGRRFRGPDTIVCISCGHRYVHSYLQKTLLALCRIISWLLGLFLLTYSVSVKQLPLLLLVIVEGIMESYLEYLIIKWLPWKEGTSW